MPTPTISAPTPTAGLSGVNANTPYQATYRGGMTAGLTNRPPKLNYSVLNQRLDTARKVVDQGPLLKELGQRVNEIKAPAPKPQTPIKPQANIGAGLMGPAAGGAAIGVLGAALTGGDVARGAVTGAASGVGYGLGAAAVTAGLAGAGLATAGLAPAIAIGVGGAIVGVGLATAAGMAYDALGNLLGGKRPGAEDAPPPPVQNLRTGGGKNGTVAGKQYDVYFSYKKYEKHPYVGIIDGGSGNSVKRFLNGPVGGTVKTGGNYQTNSASVAVSTGTGLIGLSSTTGYYPVDIDVQITSITRVDGTSQADDLKADPNYSPPTPLISPTPNGGASSSGAKPEPAPAGLGTKTPTIPAPQSGQPVRTTEYPASDGGPPYVITENPDGSRTIGRPGGGTLDMTQGGEGERIIREDGAKFPRPSGLTPGGTASPRPSSPTPIPGGGGGTSTNPIPIPGGGTSTNPIPIPGGGTSTNPTPIPGGGGGTSTNPIPIPGGGGGTSTNPTPTTNYYQSTTTNYYQTVDNRQTINNAVNPAPSGTTTAPPKEGDSSDKIDKILANTNTTLNNQATIISRIATLVADTVTAMNPLVNGVTNAISTVISNAVTNINNATTSTVNNATTTINNATTSTVNNATTTINNATTSTVNNATTTINNATTSTVNNATTTINNATTSTVNNATTTINNTTQTATDLTGLDSKLNTLTTLSQTVKEDTTSLGLIAGTLATTAYLAGQFAATNTKIDGIQPSPCQWPADRNTVVGNGNTANTTLGTITNTQLVSIDGKITQANAQLTGIDGKVTQTNSLIGLPGDALGSSTLFGRIATMQDWLGKFSKSLYLDRVYNALSIMLQLHNAAQLSRNLLDSISMLVNSAGTAFGLKNEKDEPLEITAVLGKSINSFFQSILGAEIYNGLSRSWKLTSAIWTAAVNSYELILNSMGGIAEGVQIAGNYTGRIGNALKRGGAVLENAYEWMDDNFKIKTGRLAAIDKVIDGIQNANEVTDNLTEITEVVQETTESINEIKGEVKGVKDLIKENETAKKAAETTAKTNSQSPNIAPSDLIKPGA